MLGLSSHAPTLSNAKESDKNELYRASINNNTTTRIKTTTITKCNKNDYLPKILPIAKEEVDCRTEHHP